MDLIYYVAEKLVIQQQRELQASLRKQALIREAEVNKKQNQNKKSFAITLWNIEITVRNVKQAN